MRSNNEKNYYMINMQKLLFIASELFNRGYEMFHVAPSLSPTGLAWRCSYVVIVDGEKQSITVSNWIHDYISDENGEIEKTIQELSVLLEKEYTEFFYKCKGKNNDYIKWYNEMLNKLQEGELPYAFADYFSPTDYWETSLGNKIKTPPNEIQYYDY